MPEAIEMVPLPQYAPPHEDLPEDVPGQVDAGGGDDGEEHELPVHCGSSVPKAEGPLGTLHALRLLCTKADAPPDQAVIDAGFIANKPENVPATDQDLDAAENIEPPPQGQPGVARAKGKAAGQRGRGNAGRRGRGRKRACITAQPSFPKLFSSRECVCVCACASCLL